MTPLFEIFEELTMRDGERTLLQRIAEAGTQRIEQLHLRSGERDADEEVWAAQTLAEVVK